MEMHYREDYQLVIAFVMVVHNALRESADKTPTNTFF